METEAAAKAEAERIAAEEAARRARDPREKLRADTAYCVSWYVEKWASEDSVEASTTRGYRTLARRIDEAATEGSTRLPHRPSNNGRWSSAGAGSRQ